MWWRGVADGGDRHASGLCVLLPWLGGKEAAGGGHWRTEGETGEELPHSVRVLLAHFLGFLLPPEHHCEGAAPETAKHQIPKVLLVWSSSPSVPVSRRGWNSRLRYCMTNNHVNPCILTRPLYNNIHGT